MLRARSHPTCLGTRPRDKLRASMPELTDSQIEKNLHLSELPKGRRRTAPWFAGGLVLLLLLVLIVLQMSGLWEFLTPDTAADTLLLYALSSTASRGGGVRLD